MQTNVLLQSKAAESNISQELRTTLNSIGTIKRMDKNMYLFIEGTEAEEIFIIKSGLVQVSKLTADGKEMILRICKHQDIIGELTIFSDDSRYMLSAKIIDSGEVLVVPKEQLEKALMTNNHLTFEYLKWTNNHMRKYQSKIRDLLLNGKKGALYSTLIRLSNSYGINKKDGILIDLVLTNRELANFCAATRESVNRMLVDLRKRDIITMDKSGRIFIKDIDYLRFEIGCEDCPIEICNIN